MLKDVIYNDLDLKSKWEDWVRKEKSMYHYLDDKEFLRKMRRLSGKIMQNLCHMLKEEYDIGTVFNLIGSGARNLILQNGNEKVDLDYNLEIVKYNCDYSCRDVKECVRKVFKKVLNSYGLDDCHDSKSVLTSGKISFSKENKTEFSIDVCIVAKNNVCEYNTNGTYGRYSLCKIIHDKTGLSYMDNYFWNEIRNSSEINKKANYIKEQSRWLDVRDEYLKIKNKYLSYNDPKHKKSFICYIEAVNNVYNNIRRSKDDYMCVDR